MRVWLSLALVPFVAGCADDHSRGATTHDAGGLTDAAMCIGPAMVVDGSIEGLTCPTSVTLGGRAVVTVVSRSNECCPDSAARAENVTRTMGGAEVAITAPYDLCDCCVTCRCIGSALTRDVVVAEVAGSPIHVTAGSHECTIAIDGPAICRDVPLTGGHIPTAVAALAPIPIHLVSNGGFSGCGCEPRAVVDPTGQVSLSACNCCDDCPCIDIGYETTAVQGPIEGAPQNVPITISSSPLLSTTIVDPSRCTTSSATVTGLTPLAPNDGLRQGQPVGAWVQLNAFDRRCCGEPLELVTTSRAPDGAIELTLAECRPDPCDCSPTNRRDASTPVYLGALASGAYTVRVGTVSTTLTVP